MQVRLIDGPFAEIDAVVGEFPVPGEVEAAQAHDSAALAGRLKARHHAFRSVTHQARERLPERRLVGAEGVAAFRRELRSYLLSHADEFVLEGVGGEYVLLDHAAELEERILGWLLPTLGRTADDLQLLNPAGPNDRGSVVRFRLQQIRVPANPPSQRSYSLYPNPRDEMI
ncbi:hypothetical protein ACVI1J_000089 [Bradyrhizobium diazoefficiens]